MQSSHFKTDNFEAPVSKPKKNTREREDRGDRGDRPKKKSSA